MADLEKFGITLGQGKHHEEALYSVALIYNICNNRLNNFLKKYNLNTGKLNILVAVRHQGKEQGLSQVDISKHLIVTPSNMTKLIDKLEKEGLVMRLALEGDRRVNIIKVTKKCEHLLDGMWDEYTQELKRPMDKLGEKDREVIAAKLVKWLNCLLV